jgi:hypothetical protein
VFAAAARADAESEWVTISVRLGDAGAAAQLEFSRHHREDQIQKAILSCLRLPPDTRFNLISSAGRGVVVDGRLRADDYKVEVID